MPLQSSFAQATPGDAPDVLVKRVVEDVMATVKSDKDIQAGNISRINDLVETKILPYVDFKKMTASAVGRNWSIGHVLPSRTRSPSSSGSCWSIPTPARSARCVTRPSSTSRFVPILPIPR